MSASTKLFRRFLLAVAILLASAALVACGASDSVDTASDDSAAAEEVESVDQASGSGFDTAEDSEDIAMEDDAMEEEAMAEDEAAADADGDASRALEEGEDAGTNAAGGDLGASGATPTQLTAADFGRKIIFTADITVEVDDVAAAGKEATDVIADVGGFVFGQQTQGGNQPQSVLIFKVLPEDFDRAVAALGNVGDLRNQVISADDVTERVVDLETRIEVAELGVTRLRATLESTQDLEDYAELERLPSRTREHARSNARPDPHPPGSN